MQNIKKIYWMVNTRYAVQGNLFINSTMTERYGSKALKVDGTNIWATIPNNIKESNKNIF